MQAPGARTIVVAAVLIFLIYSVELARTKSSYIADLVSGSATHSNLDAIAVSALQRAKQTSHFRVVGLVFYGRREFVSILDCYLQRNLVRNGGVLDEVIFIVRTEKSDDLDWLDGVVATTPEYTKNTMARGRNGEYSDSWNVVENGTMYIKMDDDVVFIEDNAIGALVKRKLENPDYFLVAANSINQPAQAWVHYHLNADRPYLPEISPPADFMPRNGGAYDSSPTYHSQKRPTWRASELPIWSGPDNFKVDENMPAPFVGHRWLPLPSGADIDSTPVSAVEYQQGGPGWHSWVVGAQTHYSFFENLEKNELHRYKYDLWDYHYMRISINFICIWGHDVRQVMPLDEDDEGYLTTKATKNLGRHAVMDGTGLVVHFGFGAQVIAHDWHGIHDTDALDRYRAFSEERVCGKHRGTMMNS